MYRKITAKMQYPQAWAGSAEKPSRWRRLDQLDRLLDGTFYDHLQHSFYDETTPGTDTMIPIEDRRPSSQYHLPSMVATWSARKLWAGRHTPRIHHEDASVSRVVDQLVETTAFFDRMMTATVLGSVGSVGITFRVDRTQDEPQVGFRVWRAKFCTPSFDDFDNLTNLRVAYPVTGRQLLASSFVSSADGQPISRDQMYWWIRDYGSGTEVTYVPAKADDWNPEQGWTKPGLRYIPFGDPVVHGLGFVPGVWIRNLTGSVDVDGRGTWEKAKEDSIEIDYLLSQVSRGTRYNCAPELVIVGELQGGGGQDMVRGPANYIHLRAGSKQETGEAFESGEASLLEMNGTGVRSALEQIDRLRNMALEQIGATRKDPEKLKGVMSGRAMEFMDEDSHDLVMELRSSYGRGALELFRKVVRALDVGDVDPKGLKLDWPRLYQPTPEDLAHLIPALVVAATPIQAPLEPEEAAAIGGGSEGARSGPSKGEGTAGGRPSVRPTGGDVIGALLEVEEASAYLKMHMDIDLLPDAGERGVTDADEPTGTEHPPQSSESPDGDESGSVREPSPTEEMGG